MNQFVLKALFDSKKDIRRCGVRGWEHGDAAFAVIQPFTDGTALPPIAARHVVFQRAERWASPGSGHLFYFVVLQRDWKTPVKCSDNGGKLEAFLKYWSGTAGVVRPGPL